jgi:hypothetical protein
MRADEEIITPDFLFAIPGDQGITADDEIIAPVSFFVGAGDR